MIPAKPQEEQKDDNERDNQVINAKFKVLNETQKATLNILEDLKIEKDNVIKSYEALQEEVSQRKKAEEALHKAHDELEVRVNERIQELRETNEALQVQMAERKRAQEQFRLIIETAMDAVVNIDDGGAIIEWNKNAETTFGWKKEDVLGKKLSEMIIPQQYREAHEKGLKHFHATGTGPVLNKRIEITALNRLGREFPVELVITPIQLLNKLIFSAFIRDISERKQAEQKIRKFTEELQFSNKELEQFAYVASHDLQEPIRKIVGFAQLFASNFEGQLEGKPKEYLNYIIDGAKRMQTLIQDLLAYSRIGRKELTLEVLDFNGVVKEAVGNLEVAVQETKAEIIYQHLPCLSVHKSFIVQIFQDLIGNSLKYRSEEIPRVEVSAQQKNNLWEFTVADNGIGIDQQFTNKLFVIFQRLHTKDKYEGTGIGLAVSKRMVEMHGGRIWIEPHEGGGAVFKFTLPIHET